MMEEYRRYMHLNEYTYDHAGRLIDTMKKTRGNIVQPIP